MLLQLQYSLSTTCTRASHYMFHHYVHSSDKNSRTTTCVAKHPRAADVQNSLGHSANSWCDLVSHSNVCACKHDSTVCRVWRLEGIQQAVPLHNKPKQTMLCCGSGQEHIFSAVRAAAQRSSSTEQRSIKSSCNASSVGISYCFVANEHTKYD
eukprot:15377-Heterococcus_DN1.PRE.7